MQPTSQPWQKWAIAQIGQVQQIDHDHHQDDRPSKSYVAGAALDPLPLIDVDYLQCHHPAFDGGSDAQVTVDHECLYSNDHACEPYSSSDIFNEPIPQMGSGARTGSDVDMVGSQRQTLHSCRSRHREVPRQDNYECQGKVHLGFACLSPINTQKHSAMLNEAPSTPDNHYHQHRQHPAMDRPGDPSLQWICRHDAFRSTRTDFDDDDHTDGLPSGSPSQQGNMTSARPFMWNESARMVSPDTVRVLPKGGASRGLVRPTARGKSTFTASQQKKWHLRYRQLTEFRRINGHCRVPVLFPPNPALPQWIKRQRSQYKLKHSGGKSSLTDERERSLNDLDFVWDAHLDLWKLRIADCHRFLEEHGHCSIPIRLDSNPALALWAKSQRGQYRRLNEGLASSLTRDRVDDLNRVQFVWEPRSAK